MTTAKRTHPPKRTNFVKRTGAATHPCSARGRPRADGRQADLFAPAPAPAPESDPAPGTESDPAPAPPGGAAASPPAIPPGAATRAAPGAATGRSQRRGRGLARHQARRAAIGGHAVTLEIARDSQSRPQEIRLRVEGAGADFTRLLQSYLDALSLGMRGGIPLAHFIAAERRRGGPPGLAAEILDFLHAELVGRDGNAEASTPAAEEPAAEESTAGPAAGAPPARPRLTVIAGGRAAR